MGRAAEPEVDSEPDRSLGGRVRPQAQAAENVIGRRRVPPGRAAAWSSSVPQSTQAPRCRAQSAGDGPAWRWAMIDSGRGARRALRRKLTGSCGAAPIPGAGHAGGPSVDPAPGPLAAAQRLRVSPSEFESLQSMPQAQSIQCFTTEVQVQNPAAT